MSITFQEYNWKRVVCIQDPIYPAYLDTESFFKIYGDLLKTFDGSDDCSYVDFFLVVSPVDTRTLVFVDDDAREDFRELAEEMNLIPKLKEICEGESEKEKQERLKRSLDAIDHGKRGRDKQRNHEGNKKKKELSLADKSALKTAQMQKTIDKLCHQLKGEADPEIRERINQKIQRLSDLLRSEVTA